MAKAIRLSREQAYARQLTCKKRLERLKTMFKKAEELARLEAEVYVVVRHSGRFYCYSSVEHPAWPPSRDEIAKSYPLPQLVVGLSPEDPEVKADPREESIKELGS